MKYVPDDLRDKLIEEAKTEVMKLVSGFGVREEEICESAFLEQERSGML